MVPGRAGVAMIDGVVAKGFVANRAWTNTAGRAHHCRAGATTRGDDLARRCQRLRRVCYASIASYSWRSSRSRSRSRSRVAVALAFAVASALALALALALAIALALAARVARARARLRARAT